MEVEVAKKTIRPALLTNQELINEIKEPVNSAFTLNELKTEFHLRVKNRLYQYCQRLCFKNRYDENTAKEIFQTTIIKALDKIDKFVFELPISDEKLINTIYAWLNKIALNNFSDFLRKRINMSEINDEHDELESDYTLPDDFEIADGENITLKLQQAIDELTDREKLIIHLCTEYDCIDNKKHLPEKILLQLCKDLNVNKNYIRQLKLRALKKIRSKF